MTIEIKLPMSPLMDARFQNMVYAMCSKKASALVEYRIYPASKIFDFNALSWAVYGDTFDCLRSEEQQKIKTTAIYIANSWFHSRRHMVEIQ